MVRIRLSRLGRHKRPFYRIHAVDQRKQRDGAFIENLGWYNPIEQDPEKRLSVKGDRVQYWLSMGATASDTCNDLFAKLNLIDADAWKAERQKRIKRKVEKMQADAAKAAEGEKAAG
ncbi:MAG: 30S ribosomal protein S16 [Phycisphaeraceae bacterium]|nr:30S ribosomal protein S16 [Phycisphaeraceae bacterium]